MGFLKTASITAALTLAMPSALAASPGGTDQSMPTSTPTQVLLADQLKQAGLKYYGSWRCGACQYQGRLFGEAASDRLPYVECSPAGRSGPMATACVNNNIANYPTWVIDGRHHTGLMSPESLASLSNFSAQSRDTQ